jgi:uncharacterized OsmC-like protein/alpha/beta superfamily hydrolase
MPTRKITFNNNEGQALAARLEMPVDKKPLAYSLFAHCFTCSKNLNAVTHISRALMHQGIAVLRFDFTGLGESEGDFSETNFSSNVSDLVAAADFLRQNFEAPQLLIGHSLGGAAVLAAGLQLKEARAVVTLGAPASPQHVKRIFNKSLARIAHDGEAEVCIGDRPFTIKNQFIEDISKVHLKDRLKKLRKALLIMHSPQDKIVEIKNAEEIYKSVMHPKSFITLDGADHLLSKEEDSMYAGNMIAAWSQRYLKFPKNEADELITDKQVVVRTKSRYTTEIKAGQHHLMADEPEAVGGNNLGPDPYGLLLASLGACTGITLRMYANRKNWPLTEVNVHLEHSKVYQEDCMHCDDKEQKIDNIDRILELEGDLSEVQRNKLLEIADKCPVHKTLSTRTDIKTTLKEHKNTI